MKIAEVIKPIAAKTNFDIEQDQITRAAGQLKKRRAELTAKRARERLKHAQQQQSALAHKAP